MLSKFARLTAALGVGAALYAGAAQAIVLDLDGSTSNPSNVTLVWQFNNVDGANLSASALFQLDTLSATQAVFVVNVANNTLGQPGDNRFVSFGIDNVTPNLTGASVSNPGTGNIAVSWGASRNDTFPGFQKVELCLWAGQNCSGGSNSGLVEGAVDSFVLTLTGSFTGTVAFDAPFPSKWQAVGNAGNSWELAGCIQGDTSCVRVPPVQIVPEPGTLALLGFAFAGLGFARRRR